MGLSFKLMASPHDHLADIKKSILKEKGINFDKFKLDHGLSNNEPHLIHCFDENPNDPIACPFLLPPAGKLLKQKQIEYMRILMVDEDLDLNIFLAARYYYIQEGAFPPLSMQNEKNVWKMVAKMCR